MASGGPPWTLYEINTRVWLAELGVASLGAVPDAALDELSALGFDLLWLMGVWAPSPAAARAARAHPGLQAELRESLPDLSSEDVVASPYAVHRYELSPLLGAPGELAQLRARLRRRGIGLILDFVPNHTACDHPLVLARPECFAAPPPAGDGPGGAGAAPAGDLEEETFLVETAAGPRRLYHGRDPYFPPWTDTAQLDIRRRGARAALIEQLLMVAGACDGVRCDMAMLLLSEVFARTWGGRLAEVPPGEAAAGELWAEAIDAVRAAHPDFLFLAEAYWGTDRRLVHLGFDACYDKGLYDRLVAGDAAGARAELCRQRGREQHLLRFLENHDEPRAAGRLPAPLHRAAALCALCLPGVRLLHQGQLEGARRRLPVQLRRRPREEEDRELAAFYRGLLGALQDPVLRRGLFRSLAPAPAWPGNGSCDAFLLLSFDSSPLPAAAGGGAHRLLVANLSDHRAQCRAPLDLPGLGGRRVRVAERFASGPTPPGDEAGASGAPVYLRDGDELLGSGLFLDLPAHTAQLLSLEPVRCGGAG